MENLKPQIKISETEEPLTEVFFEIFAKGFGDCVQITEETVVSKHETSTSIQMVLRFRGSLLPIPK